jgi:hypothetical protein
VIRRIGMTQVATREHESLGELLVFERGRVKDDQLTTPKPSR